MYISSAPAAAQEDVKSTASSQIRKEQFSVQVGGNFTLDSEDVFIFLQFMLTFIQLQQAGTENLYPILISTRSLWTIIEVHCPM